MINRICSALLLGAFLITPAAIQARDDDHPKKYYDRNHKDYHEWNDNENTAWHRYLSERHEKDRDWDRASKRDQQAYWNWRHEHPDSH